MLDHPTVPDTIRTNGATPNPWWANAVVYQIYPRSFQDSNNDGIGDIPGITSRLDYLVQLGVDVIWLSPVFKSPQDDNGYDIADYEAIDPMFGTMEDMEELLRKAHDKGLKIIMDLVVNHTSDEHAWFQASRDKTSDYADWYIWRPAREGHEPGTPGAEPNKWGSYFGGSAWAYDEQRGEYYLHQYSKKQPDLNWDNPAVRQAVFAMMNRWMDRGIDGFRMDVITQISKTTDNNGRLPGESGSLIEDNPVGEEGYSSPFPFCSDGPHIDEYLKEMRHAVFDGREGYLTVGEAPGLSAARNGVITDPNNHELDMMFLFEHLDIDHPITKWEPGSFNVQALRNRLAAQQDAVRMSGWTSLFADNHDQPRIVSRWGDDTNELMRVRSAKALATLFHLHRGTPYIYQGEELGMTNAHFTSLDQYRDLESINAYRQRVEEARVQSHDSMMEALAISGRDNARTPMQWDDSKYAGFMSPDSTAEPWLSVNPNHDVINAAAQVNDPESVFTFYKKLIALRHVSNVVAAGTWKLADNNDPYVYAFTRKLGDDTLLVAVNLSGTTSTLPAEAMALIESRRTPQDIVITNYDAERSTRSINTAALNPWEAVVVRV